VSCAVTALQASMVARPCVTSAACVLLWYGLGTAYAASTSCPARGATLGGSQGFEVWVVTGTVHDALAGRRPARRAAIAEAGCV